MSDPRPHVGLNAQLLSGGASYRSAGIHSYIYELLRRLPAVEPGIRFTAYTGSSAPPIPGLCMRPARLPTARPAVRIFWEQVVQPLVTARERLDLLHGLAFVSPTISPCPSIVTVHDLSFALFPKLFHGMNAAYLRLFTRLSCGRAARIIAVSENTRADVIRHYHVPAWRVVAIPHGVSPVFHPRPVHEIRDFRQKHSLPEHFILAVGTLEPRKNLPMLIQAFARLALRPGQQRRDVKLALVGGKGWYFTEIFAAVEGLGLKDQVLFPGYVPGDDLPMWYNTADVLAFPSRYEGFGMPVLEAMASGTPVVVSTASSLPQVAGDAALMAAPDDVEAWAAALDRALGDAALREELRARGIARAANFTWEETAHRTAGVYHELLNEQNRQ